MRKNSLNKTGLSLSQAQSISNLCNQRAIEINNIFNRVNNAEKKLTYQGKTFIETRGVNLPLDTIELLENLSELYATQAFLMENIKAKEKALVLLKSKVFKYDVERPKSPELKEPNIIPLVDEEWGWEQLSEGELNEYYEADACASVAGKFIHKGGVLDNLRRELATIPTLEWITVKDGHKTPLEINIHHTPEKLLQLHEEIAKKHREFEQRVNYYKAKIKNLVTVENARIAKENAKVQSETAIENDQLRKEYTDEYNKWIDGYRKAQHEFEEQRQKDIKNIASLRIKIDSRFQSTIDMFLEKIKGDDDLK